MTKENKSIKISNILCEMPCGDISDAKTCAKYQNWAYKEIEKLLVSQHQEIIERIEKTTMRGMVYDGVRSKEIINLIKEDA